MRWKVAAVAVALLLAAHQAAALDVDITPVPPPGLGEKIGMFVGWLYYLAIVASVGGVIAGAAMLWTGKDQGRFVLIASLVSLAILASLPMIIKVI